MQAYPVSEVPSDILLNLRDDADNAAWWEMYGSLMRMSPLKYVVYTDDGLPLLAVGGYQASLFVPEIEVWLLPTNFLGVQHLRAARIAFYSWLDNNYVERGYTILARASLKNEKWLRFFGGQYLRDLEDGTKLFEVKPWPHSPS